MGVPPCKSKRSAHCAPHLSAVVRKIIFPSPVRTYDHNGLTPYSAGDLFAMDEFVPDDFSGNVTTGLIRRGAIWDESSQRLTVTGMKYPIQFVAR